MVILCPFVPGMLRDETAACLEAEDGVWFYRLDPDDPCAYGNLLARFWEEPEDLLIVEQDIVAEPYDFQLMRDCLMPYCAAPYPWKTDVGPALGFTRFRREFMLKYPTVMAEAASRCTWRQLDTTLQRSILVRQHGEQPHVHFQVTHLNEAKALRPDANPTPLKELPAW